MWKEVTERSAGFMEEISPERLSDGGLMDLINPQNKKTVLLTNTFICLTS